MNLLVFATTAPQQNSSGIINMVVILVLFLAVMYFFTIRPQKKREKESRDMLGKLAAGDKIVTIGGIVGEVVNVGDGEVTIVTSVEKTQMVFVKEAIKQVTPKETQEEKKSE